MLRRRREAVTTTGYPLAPWELPGGDGSVLAHSLAHPRASPPPPETQSALATPPRPILAMPCVVLEPTGIFAQTSATSGGYRASETGCVSACAFLLVPSGTQRHRSGADRGPTVLEHESDASIAVGTCRFGQIQQDATTMPTTTIVPRPHARD